MNGTVTLIITDNNLITPLVSTLICAWPQMLFCTTKDVFFQSCFQSTHLYLAFGDLCWEFVTSNLEALIFRFRFSPFMNLINSGFFRFRFTFCVPLIFSITYTHTHTHTHYNILYIYIYIFILFIFIFIFYSGVGRCQKVGGTQTRNLCTFGKEPI